MTIEDRIDCLELHIRRQRLGIIALGLGIAGALFLGMSQQTPKNLSVESLTILADGKARIAMGTNPDSSVGIAFLDHQGLTRAALGTDAKGDGGLVMMDKKESPRVLIGSGANGSGIMLIDANLTTVSVPTKQDTD
jgi:hypothetical protein|tara:strand:- start:6 stop:413 length:408 start_codon:yes stop_codon:yes gene_type:complete